MGKAHVDETKVFISSAMRKADDVDWPTLRQEVYDVLFKDEQFNPFGIENEASSRPSLQFFLSQVEQTDFVVGMVGKELRPGTKRELELAFKKNKKVLLYFIGEEQEGDALAFKRNVQEADSCCYCQVDTQTCLPEEIVINLKSELTRLSRGFEPQSTFADAEPALIEYSGLPRATFSFFGGAGDALFQRLGLDRFSQHKTEDAAAPLEDFGRDVTLWVLDNKSFSMASHEDALRGALPALAESEDKYGLRASCGSALHGDYHDACSRLQKALESVGESEDWQFGVALVDLRNYALLKGDTEAYCAAQKRLDALKSSVVFPACEHCLRQADDAMHDIEEWKRGLTVNTRGFNSKYNEVINAAINALFVAALYGSFSRMCSSRKYLARALSFLARVYDAPEFAYHAARLSFVGGDEKTARNICRHDWPLVANVIPAHADELWEAACLCSGGDSVRIQCVCVELLAPYFTEGPLPEISALLREDATRRAYPKQWSQAIANVSMRLGSPMLVDSLCAVLEAEDTISLSYFDTILSNVHWGDVGEAHKTRFMSAFSEHWKWYLDSGRSAEPIAQLIVEGALPRELAKAVGKSLSGVTKAAFYGHLNGWDDYGELFEESVKMAESQLDANSSGCVYFTFSIDPYASINCAIKEGGAGLLDTEAGAKLLALFLKAAKTTAADEMLSPMLESMVLCVAELVSSDMDLPSKLTEAAGAFRRTSTTMSLYMFGGSTEAAWQVRLSALRAVCGIGQVDEMISVYLSARADYKASSALGRLMPDLLRVFRIKDIGKLQALALVLSELAVDTHPEVRKLVPKGAIELIGTEEEEYGYRLLTLLVKDADPEVRLSVMRACADERVVAKYRSTVQELLAQDADYHLRHHAEKQRANAQDTF